MAITVGDIYTAFPTFNPKDMIDLVGTEDFNGRTQIKLSDIARYNGRMAQELSIFTAQKEGKNYTNLLSKAERANISEKADIKTDENKPRDYAQHKGTGSLPMDISIFDINNKQV